MDFQNVNSLNVWLNLLSGNLLPINRDLPFSFSWKIHSIFVWLTQFIISVVMIPGCIYVTREKALKDGMICIVIAVEVFFMILRIRAHKDLIYQLIQKLNEILHNADETMKNVVTTTFEPVKIPLNFYCFAGVISIIAWGCIPFVLVFKKNLFYYEDYRIPAIFSKQPFSLRVFVLGSLFILINMIYLFLKKIGVEVYTVHLVLMITAQYRYIALKMAMIIQEKNESDEFQNKHFSGLDRRKEKEMKALCRHHRDVI